MSSPYVLHTACTYMHMPLMYSPILKGERRCHMSSPHSLATWHALIYSPTSHLVYIDLVGHQSNQVRSLVHSHMVSELWNDHLFLPLPPSLSGMTSPHIKWRNISINTSAFFSSKEAWRITFSSLKLAAKA